MCPSPSPHPRLYREQLEPCPRMPHPILSSASPFDHRARLASGSKSTADVDVLDSPWLYGRARHGASRPPPSPLRPPSGAVEHRGPLPAVARAPSCPFADIVAFVCGHGRTLVVAGAARGAVPSHALRVPGRGGARRPRHHPRPPLCRWRPPGSPSRPARRRPQQRPPRSLAVPRARRSPAWPPASSASAPVPPIAGGLAAPVDGDAAVLNLLSSRTRARRSKVSQSFNKS